MKKLFAILALAGTLAACNNDAETKADPAATVDAAKATADSALAKMKADSMAAAAKMNSMDTSKMMNKMKEGAEEMKEGANKMKEAVKDTMKKH